MRGRAPLPPLLLGLFLGLLACPSSSYQPSPSSPSWSRASRALFRRSAATDGSTALLRRRASSVSVPFDPNAAANLPNERAVDVAEGGGTTSRELGPLQARLTKIGMMMYILGMCLALPLTLAPISLLERLKIIDRLQREQFSLRTGCFCSRWLMRLIPFANVKVVGYDEDDPEPSVWVCNHTSMLDVFVMLAVDKKLRGRQRRPLKIVYWKGLEKNPVTKLLFTMCGMIAVDMADNGNGNDNEYDMKSFKPLLKSIKQAFVEGFDVGLLPEGQLNPAPEKGLLPVFSGAFTLAKMSRRGIRMMALHGVEKLWHSDESIGMSPTARDVTVRAYPPMSKAFESGDEFCTVFRTVVGHFGATGRDVPNLDRWLDGSNWREIQRRAEEEKKEQEEEGSG